MNVTIYFASTNVEYTGILEQATFKKSFINSFDMYDDNDNGRALFQIIVSDKAELERLLDAIPTTTYEKYNPINEYDGDEDFNEDKEEEEYRRRWQAEENEALEFVERRGAFSSEESLSIWGY